MEVAAIEWQALRQLPHKLQCYFFYCLFLAFHGFIDSTAEEVTGNRVKESVSDMQQRGPGWESNPGLLQRGQSLCTWDTCSTHWAKWQPSCNVNFEPKFLEESRRYLICLSLWCPHFSSTEIKKTSQSSAMSPVTQYINILAITITAFSKICRSLGGIFPLILMGPFYLFSPLKHSALCSVIKMLHYFSSFSLLLFSLSAFSNFEKFSFFCKFLTIHSYNFLHFRQYIQQISKIPSAFTFTLYCRRKCNFPSFQLNLWHIAHLKQYTVILLTWMEDDDAFETKWMNLSNQRSVFVLFSSCK